MEIGNKSDQDENKEIPHLQTAEEILGSYRNREDYDLTYNREKIQHTADEYNLDMDILMQSPDPVAEVDRYRSAQLLSEATGIELKVAYENFDELSYDYFQEHLPAKNAFEALGAEFDYARKSAKLGTLYFQKMKGNESDGLNTKISELETSLPNLSMMSKGWGTRVFRAVGKLAGSMSYTLQKSAMAGMAGAAGGAGAALIGGQAGPQVLVPEEILTVPLFATAGFTIGSIVGGGKVAGEMEAGLMYKELLALKDEDGEQINQDITRNIALAVGVINGAIEFIQVGKIPGIKQLLSKSLGRVTKKTMLNGSIKQLALKTARDHGKYILGNTVEEVMQETVNIIGENMAIDLSGQNIDKKSIDEVITQLTDTAIDTAIGTAVIGIPGHAVNAVTEYKNSSTAKQAPTEMESPQNATEPQENQGIQDVKPISDTKEQININVQNNGFITGFETIEQEDPVTGEIKGREADRFYLLNPKSGEREAQIDFTYDEDLDIVIEDVEAYSPAAFKEAITALKEDTPGVSIRINAQRGTLAFYDDLLNNRLPIADDQRPIQTTVLPVTDKESLKENLLTHFPGFTEDHAESAVKLIESRARAMGIDAKDWINKYLSEDAFISGIDLGPNKKGARRLLQDGKVAFYLTEKSDFSTFVHETAHIIRKQLQGAEIRALSSWAGVGKDGVWSVESEERFANALTEYLKDGKPVDPTLKNIFNKIAQYLKEIYHSIKNTATIPAEISKVFEGLFKGEEKQTDQTLTTTEDKNVVPEESKQAEDKIYRPEAVPASEILFQSEDFYENLKEEARSFETWEEFRDFNEAMDIDPESELNKKTAKMNDLKKGDWYRKVWEEARGIDSEAQDFLSRDEANRQFIDFLEDTGGVEFILENLARSGDINAIRLHPLIFACSLRVGFKNMPLSKRARASVIGLLKKDIIMARELFAQYAQDVPSMRQLEYEKALYDQTVSVEERELLIKSLSNDTERMETWKGVIKLKKVFSDYDALEAQCDELTRKYGEALHFKEAYQASAQTRGEVLKETSAQLEKTTRDLALTKEAGKEALTSARQEALLQGKLVSQETRKRINGVLKRRLEKTTRDLALTKEAGKEALASAQQEARLQGKLVSQETRKRINEVLKRRNDKKLQRQYALTLVKSIMMKPGKSIELGWRKVIEEIQEGIDPHFRSKKHLDLRKHFVNLSRGAPEISSFIKEHGIETLMKKPLNEFTLADLEKLNKEVEWLRNQGREVQRMIVHATMRRRYEIADQMVSTAIMNTGPDRLSKYAQGSEEWKARAKKGKLKRIEETLFGRPDRLFRKMDGGSEGIFTKHIWKKVNYITDQYLTKTDERKKALFNKMVDLGLKARDLTRPIKQNKVTYQAQDVMYFYVGMKNQRTRSAILFGKKLEESDVLAMIRELTEPEKILAHFISEEFDRHYDRLRDAYIQDKNEELGKEVSYLPMYRLDAGGEKLDQELFKELATRSAYIKAYPDKRMTKSRIDIAPEHQKPIRTDLLGVTLQAIDIQEHYIASWDFVKDTQYILSQDNVRNSIRDAYGDEYVRYLKKYINNFADPKALRDQGFFDKIASVAMKNMAIAYLGLNASVVLKQIPSLALYLNYSGSLKMAGAIGKFVANPIKFIKRIEALDPQIKHRAIDPFLEALKDYKKDRGAQAKAKIDRIATLGIEVFDKAIATIGWQAVYDKARDDGFSDQDARWKAQDATLKTQSAARMKDLPEVYRNNSSFSKLFLVFSNQINQMYNIMRYDIPTAIKNKSLKSSTYLALGLALTFIIEGMVTNREPPEDPEQIGEWLTSGSLGLIPLFGRNIEAGLKGFRSTGVSLFKISDVFRKAGEVFGSDDPEVNKALKFASSRETIEALALITGMPYSGPKKIARAMINKDPLDAVAYQREKDKK